MMIPLLISFCFNFYFPCSQIFYDFLFAYDYFKSYLKTSGFKCTTIIRLLFKNYLGYLTYL